MEFALEISLLVVVCLLLAGTFGLLWVPALSACTDRCIVGDHVGYDCMALHHSEGTNGLLVLLDLFPRTDRCTVSDHVGHDGCRCITRKGRKGPLALQACFPIH